MFSKEWGRISLMTFRKNGESTRRGDSHHMMVNERINYGFCLALLRNLDGFELMAIHKKSGEVRVTSRCRKFPGADAPCSAPVRHRPVTLNILNYFRRLDSVLHSIKVSMIDF